MPGKDSPFDTAHKQTGATHSEWSRAATRDGRRPNVSAGRPDLATIDGLSIWKGPIGRITAIDMNTGEHLWVIPNGDAEKDVQESIRNHPLVQGVAGAPTNPGRRGWSIMVATPTLLMASGRSSDGTWKLFAIDKRTGERLGAVDIPGATRYGMPSWVHEGKQYVVIQLRDGLAAMALP